MLFLNKLKTGWGWGEEAAALVLEPSNARAQRRWVLCRVLRAVASSLKGFGGGSESGLRFPLPTLILVLIQPLSRVGEFPPAGLAVGSLVIPL